MSTIEFPKSEIVQLNKMVAYQPGSIVSRIMIKKPSGNLTLFAFDKGQLLSEHTAPFDAIIQVLEGKAEVIIGGKLNQLSAGDTIIMPAHIPHAVNASESFKMLLTMVKE